MANHTPTAQGSSQTGVAAGAQISLASLFSYSDADGLSDIVSFDVRLQTSDGGHLYHNGVLWPDGQLTPDQPISTLSQWTYVTGPAGTSDTIGFNVTDHAGAFNPTATATVSTQAANHAPTAQGNSETGIAAGAQISLASLFSYSDADGLSDIVSFDVRLQTSNGGHLYHNGVLWPDGQLTPEQSISTLNQWTYVAGPAGTSDTIGFNVTDHAGAFNPTATATVSTQAANHAPTAQGSSQTGVAVGAQISLASLFSYSDADGLSDIVSFDVRLQTSNGGHLYHNGVLWPDGQLTPDQPISTLSQWTYVAGPAGTSETIGFNVTDHAGAFNPTATATVSTQGGGGGGADYDATIVPSGIITQHFAAQSPWGSIALNTSDIPQGHANDPLTHPAVDIMAPLGTEVDAFTSGTVVAESTGSSDSTWSSLGWYVLIRTVGSTAPDVAGGKDFYSLYLHLNSQPLVSLNQAVTMGTKIGVVGTTGNETGVPAGDGLLHFEIRLFSDLFQPYSEWNLPKISGSKSNIYIYGAENAAQLLADPANTGLGYINPESFLREGSSSDARPTATGHDQNAAAGTIIPLGTLFSYSDPDGLSDIVGFSVQDHTTGGGYLALDGVKQSDNVVYGDSTYGIPISQISHWTYVVGPAGSVDSIAFNAVDSYGQYNPAAYATVTSQGSGGGGTASGIDYRVQTGTALIGVDVAAIKSDGYQFVGEYIGNASNSGYLTQSDAQTLGLPIVSLYERSPNHIGYFTTAQADLDASGSASAITAAENVVHQPLGTAIYFTVDPAAEAGVYPSGSGALPSNYIAAIKTYFQEISADFAAAGNPYKIGVYGPGDVLTAIKSLNLSNIAYYWLDTHWGTTFSGANIQRGSNQVSATPISIGVSVDTDTALTSDFGQWNGTTSNHAPVLTIPSANVAATAGQVIAASSLFSASDADNDTLTYYLYANTPAAGSGHFVVNGTVVPAGTGYAVTAAQLAQTTFVAGARGSSDDLYVKAYDGQAYSGGGFYSNFHVNVAANHAPVVTIPSANVAATAGQVIAASILFNASDADNDTLTYYLYDNTPAASSGHFVVNGTVVPAGTGYAVTAAQLAQTTFVAGASGNSDDLYVKVYDGQDYSGGGFYSNFHVSVVSTNHAPVVTILTANVAATAGQVIAASNLFSASDADNDALTYYLYDNSPAASSGHFVVNGNAVPADTPYAITAAQLAQTSFVAGAAGSSDDLYVKAYDGQDYSGGGYYNNFHVNVVSTTNHPPVVTIPTANVSASAGQVIAASSLFSASDADNDALTYYLYDNSPAASSGHFVVNGAVVPAGTPYAITAAQLAQTSFVAGAAGSSDDLYVKAYDGQAYSGGGYYSNFHVNVAGSNHPPVVTIPSTVVTASAGQVIAATSLFSATDADNDPLTYYLYDNSPAANSGHFAVNGNAVPADTPYAITAAQLAQTTFVAGAAGSSDDLYVKAYDGHDYSGGGFYSYFHIVV